MNKAMILAAGRGQRMGDLTNHCPKPLLLVGNQYLIEHAILGIKQSGIHEIVINVSYQSEQIKNALGDGSRYGVKILYSEEVERLETGGGIFKALPLLGNQPFLVMSCDIITDFPLHQLPEQPQGLAHLVMVANPSFHLNGDYGLRNGMLEADSEQKFTYANIGVFRSEIFANCEPGYFKLNEILHPAVIEKKITGEQYKGMWHNIGTPADIEEVTKKLPTVTY